MRSIDAAANRLSRHRFVRVECVSLSAPVRHFADGAGAAFRVCRDWATVHVSPGFCRIFRLLCLSRSSVDIGMLLNLPVSCPLILSRHRARRFVLATIDPFWGVVDWGESAPRAIRSFAYARRHWFGAFGSCAALMCYELSRELVGNSPQRRKFPRRRGWRPQTGDCSPRFPVIWVCRVFFVFYGAEHPRCANAVFGSREKSVVRISAASS